MEIRNIAIIAHVDHGKTTLKDLFLLRQSGTFFKSWKSCRKSYRGSTEIERERGITIFSKMPLIYNKHKINIVRYTWTCWFWRRSMQRILKMVDLVLLLVEAEGVMPQTKYVLKQALEHGLNPIVIVNKIDRENSILKLF